MSLPSRIIRVRLDRALQIVYSEDDPTGQKFPEIVRPISFGGVLGPLTSIIFLSPTRESRELIFFDKYIPFNELYWIHLLTPDAAPFPPTIGAIAVKLGTFPAKFSTFFSFSVSKCSPRVECLMLVCSSDNLRTIATNVLEDQWGFRRIHASSVEALEPEQYKVGKSLIAQFSTRAGYEINFIYVVDSEQSNTSK